jgi:CSLREA domain-containing protein
MRSRSLFCACIRPGRLPRRLIALSALCLVASALGCGEDTQPPTAPTPPAGPGGPAFRHTAGHKVVNSLADPGDGPCDATQCTLREAINDPESTEISFAPGLTGPITLARPAAGGGQLLLDKTLTITGPNAGITIRRRSTDPDFRIIRIASGVTVTLTNLILRNGKTDRAGGGIFNDGTLSLVKTTVADNTAAVPGGGIANYGPLILTSSTVAGNTGGGIDNHGPLTLTNSTVAHNSGAGIANYINRTLTLTNSTIARNSGVGIGNRGGTLTLIHSTVAYNSNGGIASGGTSTLTYARIVGNSTTGEGGGIANAGGLTLTNSTVARNSAASGGGIANREPGGVTITKSTVVGNSATQEGGGIFNHALGFCRSGAGVTLTNSTVSGNSAGRGGGISNSGPCPAGVTLTNSTVARNSATQEGGGIRLASAEGGSELTNTLVAQNSAPTGPDVLVLPSPESVVFARFNLIGDGSGSGITNTDGNQVGKVSPNSLPIDPRLGPLADNGGPTRTHALLLGSPAIDAASTPDCPTTDQRGVLRPQGAACDIGSYEREVTASE